jgi:hypothetical protein
MNPNKIISSFFHGTYFTNRFILGNFMAITSGKLYVYPKMPQKLIVVPMVVFEN